MNFDDRTMATTMDSGWHTSLLNKFAFPFEEDYISSEELHRCIEEDSTAYPYDMTPWGDNSPLKTDDDLWKSKDTGFLSKFLEDIPYCISPQSDPILSLPEAHRILINPVTGFSVTDPEWIVPNYSPEPIASPNQSPETVKPYHPSQDHDYPKMIPEEEEDVEVKEEMNEDEPFVDVWKIENFGDEQGSTPNRVSEQLSTPRPVIKKETRRTSKRAADIRRREQARSISNAVHAVLNIKRPRNIGHYKNMKVKNSVETTPSQSDIEEWHSQPVRQTHTKATKKKTSKGRIDHSESERHRREVLRTNFHSLSELIPVQFLRGEKASSQISKQKILNGGKAFITEMCMSKSSYKAIRQHNELFRDLWQKINSSNLPKCIKR